MQTINITANKPEKHPQRDAEYFDEFDFNPDNRPLEPYVPSKQDGWKPVSEGSYRKQIDPAE